MEVTKDHELVKAKVSAGLPIEDAIEVVSRQLEHDAALKAAAAKAKKADK